MRGVTGLTFIVAGIIFAWLVVTGRFPPSVTTTTSWGTIMQNIIGPGIAAAQKSQQQAASQNSVLGNISQAINQAAGGHQ